MKFTNLRVNKSELSPADLNNVLDRMVYGLMQAQENVELGDLIAAVSHIQYKVIGPMDALGITPQELQVYYEANFHTL